MIYLDNAATTKTAEEVVETMLPFYTQFYGNPSTVYGMGAKAKKLVNQTKRTIASSIHAKMEEIYFTSGGTEADNWALQAACAAMAGKGKHIITSAIEHHAVLHTLEALEKRGYEVTYLPVNEDGFVELLQVEKAIRPDTALISIMYANNEIGTIQPIEKIGRIARERGILFHTDAVQAYGHLPIDVEQSCIDLMSTSAHKLNGPKGIGFLYVRSGIPVEPLLYGGGQEGGKRSGTENVPAIAGFGKAVELSVERMEEKTKKESFLRDRLTEGLLAEIPHCLLNGGRVNRLSNNVNISLPGLEGESLIIMMDMQGICASSGSACTTGSNVPSHVLTALGRSAVEANGSLRLTLSAENTEEEIVQTIETVKELAKKLRSMSQVYEAYCKK